LLIGLTACPYLGEQGYTDKVRDLDGDGLVAERFGGLDCDDDDPGIGDCDADRDGVRSTAAGGEDCDDADASVYPGAPEQCDGRDHDCDGLVGNDDELGELAPLVYEDADGDGFGATTLSKPWCGEPEPGWVRSERLGDCADGDPERYPGADERCDAIDWNCDGDPTLRAVDAPSWWEDADRDGFGDGPVIAVQCEPPTEDAAVYDAGLRDCEPLEPTVYPGAYEVPYDGIDQDCSGADLTDVDGDGFAGGPDGVDCDDQSVAVSPAQKEVCNGVDDDCDGATDEDVLGVYYLDADGDGHGGEQAVPVAACSAPADHVASHDDCDDSNPARSPTQTEICDDLDNDCDGRVDTGAIDQITRYGDLDGDLFGDPELVWVGCAGDEPSGTWLEEGLDCDDGSPNVNPLQAEVCDTRDNDCDGLVDEQATDAVQAWVDADGDGQGDPAQPVLVCLVEEGVSPNFDDCDDSDPETYLGAVEQCFDAVRQDCSLVPADDCDGDGTTDLADCEPTDPAIHPFADEVCDGRDNDCDGATDSADPSVDPSTAKQWYLDDDGDGFGGTIPLGGITCDPPTDGVAVQGDCDDADPTAYPFAPELCDDADNDCDGQADEDPADPTAWYRDLDGDNHGSPASATPRLQCDTPGTGWVTSGDDCSDANAAVSPDAPEACDAVDNDCDGLVDDADTLDVPTLWFPDVDRDGYGSGAPLAQCVQPAATAPRDGDCDDSDDLRSPGAPELCDGIDNDCDGLTDLDDPDLAGLTTFYLDSDGDGFGSGAPVEACAAPPNHVIVSGDCDDSDPQRSPAALEVCDGLENNCDGQVDEGDGLVAPTWYADLDGDGWGDPSNATASCVRPTDHVDLAGDCRDAGAAAAISYPGAPEACDGIDTDCDGLDDLDDPDAQPMSWYVDVDLDGDGDVADVNPTVSCEPPAPTGYAPTHTDCDDADANRSGIAEEVCDTIDNDCDNLVDDQDDDAVGLITAYPDLDGDDAGDNSAVPVMVCTLGPDQVAVAGDCDDTEPLRYLGRSEACGDGIDNDCDQLVDEEGTLLSFARDLDGDGMYMPESFDRCADPDGAGTAWIWPIPNNADDCDDDDPTVFLGAPEVCDGARNDCTVAPPDQGAIDQLTYYPDADSDGFGDPVFAEGACGPPSADHVLMAGDCDDANPFVKPTIPYEDCDTPYDDNCDGAVDTLGDAAILINGDEVFVHIDGSTPVDGDEDGFVDEAFDLGDLARLASCTPQVGPRELGDCDDAVPTIFPGANEICDTVDNNCDGNVDAADPTLDPNGALDLHLDVDRDGAGAPQIVGLVCAGDQVPEGFVAPDGQPLDCDDGEPLRYPGYGPEDCDGLDNDCSGEPGPAEFDNDDDGYVACAYAAHGWQALPLPQGDDDCDDLDKDRTPGALEVCDGLDNNCDEVLPTDEVDTDSDTYVECSVVAPGWKGNPLVVGGDDCAPSDPARYPFQTVTVDNTGGGDFATVQAAVDAMCSSSTAMVTTTGTAYGAVILPATYAVQVVGDGGRPVLTGVGAATVQAFGTPSGTRLQGLELTHLGVVHALVANSGAQLELEDVDFTGSNGATLGMLVNGTGTDVTCIDCTAAGLVGDNNFAPVLDLASSANFTWLGGVITSSDLADQAAVEVDSGGTLFIDQVAFGDNAKGAGDTGQEATSVHAAGNGTVVVLQGVEIASDVSFDRQPVVLIDSSAYASLIDVRLRDTAGGIWVAGADVDILRLDARRVGGNATEGVVEIRGNTSNVTVFNSLIADGPGPAISVENNGTTLEVSQSTLVRQRYGISVESGNPSVSHAHTAFYDHSLGDLDGLPQEFALNNWYEPTIACMPQPCPELELMTYMPTLHSDLWLLADEPTGEWSILEAGYLYGPDGAATSFYTKGPNGLYDGWEQHWFGTIGVNETADPDLDGLLNEQEYNRGTDPQSNDTDGDGFLDNDGVEVGNELDCNQPAANCP